MLILKMYQFKRKCIISRSPKKLVKSFVYEKLFVDCDVAGYVPWLSNY